MTAAPTASRSIGETLRGARHDLQRAPFQPSGREAALLMAHVLQLDEASILARSNQPVTETEASTFETLLERRLKGEPVAYLLGEKEFYGRRFMVDNRVLIPRPETEHLVEEALRLELPEDARILDIGTGSGCVALTLALELPASRVLACDVSPSALAVAAENRRRLGLANRVALAAMDVARPIRLGVFDLVVGNPPYVDPADAPLLSHEITAFEPWMALFPPVSGTHFGRRMLAELGSIREGCRVLMEIGAGQRAALIAAARHTDFELVSTREDYAGIPRVLSFERRAEHR